MTISEGEYQSSLVDPEPWDDEDAIYDCSAIHPLEEPLRIERGFWMVASGDLVKITEMTDEHLRNAISWAERTWIGCVPLQLEDDFSRADKLEELRCELRSREASR